MENEGRACLKSQSNQASIQDAILVLETRSATAGLSLHLGRGWCCSTRIWTLFSVWALLCQGWNERPDRPPGAGDCRVGIAALPGDWRGLRVREKDWSWAPRDQAKDVAAVLPKELSLPGACLAHRMLPARVPGIEKQDPRGDPLTLPDSPHPQLRSLCLFSLGSTH